MTGRLPLVRIVAVVGSYGSRFPNHPIGGTDASKSSSGARSSSFKMANGGVCLWELPDDLKTLGVKG